MSRYTTSAQSALGREVAEKRRLMYERHGGIMSPTDVAREAGYFARAVNGGPVGRGARDPGDPDGGQKAGLRNGSGGEGDRPEPWNGIKTPRRMSRSDRAANLIDYAD